MRIILIISLLVITITLVNSQLLGSKRYDYRNVTSTDVNDFVEFSICGFEASQLDDMAKQIRNFRTQINFLSGENYNTSQVGGITGCDDKDQLLTVFAVRARFVIKVLQLLKTQGFNQHITCVDEIMMRQYLSDEFGQADYTSRFSIQKTENAYRLNIGPKLVRMVFHDSIDQENLVDQNGTLFEQNTGVDFCLYSPANHQTDANDDSDPNHNRGLGPSTWYVNHCSRTLSPWIENPDVMVLGALVALEEWFKGPKVNFRFGRKQGMCEKTLCVREGCQQNQQMFLKNAPSSENWNNFDNLDLFAQQGFTSKQAVALMGAHTIGGVNVCTGFGALNNGPFCKADKESNKKELDKGSFFDMTPMQFDNNYFQMLQQVDLQNKNVTVPKCQQLLVDGRKDQRKGTNVFNQKCELAQYCNQTNGRSSHLKNLQNISFIGKQFRRIVHLPADWANLLNEETAQHVHEFANDQSEFLNTFASAFEKVSNKGYSESELKQCQAVQCLRNIDTLECQTKYEDVLTFDLNGDQCQISPEDSDCSLVGGYGILGVIQCRGNRYLCSRSNSVQNQKTQLKFLTANGQNNWN